MSKSTKTRLFVLLTLNLNLKSTKLGLFVLLMTKNKLKRTKPGHFVLLSLLGFYISSQRMSLSRFQ